MLARNYKVTACDLSPAMVARARERLGDRGEAAVADMRALPWRERFDLVTCLDDAVNYLLDPGDLTAALRSMRRALVPGGTLVFDVNTMRTYRSTFGSEFEVDSGSRRFRWSGAPVGARGPAPGGVFSARIEVLDGEGGARPSGGRHTQRHHPRPAVEASCRAAGLRVLDVRGLLPGGALDSDGDEDRHLKLIYVARRPPLRSASPRLHPASARAPRALPSSRKVHTRGGDRK